MTQYFQPMSWKETEKRTALPDSTTGSQHPSLKVGLIPASPSLHPPVLWRGANRNSNHTSATTSADERLKLLKKKLHLCFSCFKTNQISSECRSRLTCYKCSKQHHTLLHDTTPKQSPSTGPPLSSKTDRVPHEASYPPSVPSSILWISLPHFSYKVSPSYRSCVDGT